MKDQEKITPPRWARLFLSWYCRPELLEDLEGDLNEYFERNLKIKGARKAKVIYIIDVIKFIRSYTMKKPQPAGTMSLFMFQNYFKTSLRNIERNKLFSAINIVGLAISMCVGLLLIAFVAEVKSYDNFHEHADRIFRINNVLQEINGPSYNYATTSLLTGKQIKERVAGIEQVVVIRRGFNKDLRFNDKIVPLRGFWADESFFRVFSFGMLSGNAATALNEPNSVVLTQSSAAKLFGDLDVIGKSVQIDSANYMVTGVVKDTPLNSHMRFDMLGSFITIDREKHAEQDKGWMKWDNMWSSYVYVLLPENGNVEAIKESLSRISDEGNKTIENRKINLYLEPLREIVLTRNMSNPIGPTVDKSIVVTLGILAMVVILSACFNYTNLSIARALRRTREVGIRKAVGASRRQVFYQFVFESILLSLLSLGVSFVIFLFIRAEFLSMDNTFQEMVTLEPTGRIYLYFIGLAITVGLVAGLLPASFFSKINTAIVLKDVSAIKLFRHVNLRKALITFQYTLSILFIVLVSIGYKQYRYSLSFDLGFKTENILALDLQGNKPGPLLKELSELPEVRQIAKAKYVSSVGTNISGNVKYKDPTDSIRLHYNFVDQEYISLHEHKILAGKNFSSVIAEEAKEPGVIINIHTVKWMQLSDPHQALGEELVIDGQKNKIIGVVEDFHHERTNYPIENFAFRYDPKQFEVLSLKIESPDILVTMDKIQAVWKKIDTVHPLEAKFYEDHIHDAYGKLSWIIKIIGFIAFLSICIASLGLLGMVIFTTETRLKEISIRKVLGASERNLVFLMSRGFIVLLLVSSMIATPSAYYFMDQVVLAKHVYRAPIGLTDLLMGTLAVMSIAILMLGTQTLKVARSNPAEVLKNE